MTGTIVTVTNPANGELVDVEVNDRGSQFKKFKINLSVAKAKAVGFYGKGVAKLRYSQFFIISNTIFSDLLILINNN